MIEFGSLGTLSEGAFRFLVFASILLIMAALEILSPKRKLRNNKTRRWITNLSIVGIDGFFVRLMGLAAVPLTAVAAALYCEAKGIGLFNWLQLPLWLEIVAVVIILDFAIYLQHWASHKVDLLWKVHRMHHADVDFDVTTALRFHPIEIVLSMLYKVVLVFLLGPAAVAVVIFEVILNGSAMFNHANLAMPPWLDRILRLIIVTPDMHRVHHSIHQREHDSNYGFALSIWDRLFATYTPQPRDGHEGMTIGLPQWQNDKPTKLLWTLSVPFLKDDTAQDSRSPAKQPPAASSPEKPKKASAE